MCTTAYAKETKFPNLTFQLKIYDEVKTTNIAGLASNETTACVLN